MTREEVRERLDVWAENGLLCSKRSTGYDYTAIKRMIGNGELYATSYENVVTRSEDVRDEFEKYVKEGQIMNTAAVMARTGLTTAYRISLACAEGQLLRFGKLGNGAVLYIKD
jgi:hypothetical protein